MQIVRLILIGLMLTLAGCDSARIAELESENNQLKTSLADFNQRTALDLAKWELAASTYNGCMSLAGFGSFLCPDSALVLGETAVNNGLVGASIRYWVIFSAKLIMLLGVIGFVFFGAWLLYVKRILPDKHTINEAIKLVNEVETKVENAKIEEFKLLGTLVIIEQDIEILNDKKKSAYYELEAIMKKKQETEIMAKAMKAFD